MNNYIYEYYQKITDGTIIVGRWVKIWYKYVVDGLENGLFHFDPKKAQKSIRFVENFCRHHEGALAPQLIVLELWQKALLSVLFGVMDDTGHRQFREVFIVIARKNGKTLLAAAIAAYCSFLDGEYGGRIYFPAPKLEQAGLCYDAYYQMLSKDPELSQLSKKRRTDIYIANSNTSAKPLAFSAKKSDGLNVSLCVADEVASWPGDAGLKFYEVIKSSFGARTQPMLLSISTAGYVNEGIYDELMKRSTRFLLGDSKEMRIAPFIYMIDDPAKWNDINELAKANPNLGVSISVSYLLEEIAIAEGSLSKLAEFLTKYCNIKQNSSLAWLASDVVERACGAHIDPANYRNCYCVGGIDLSRTTDLTACVAIIEKDSKLNVLAHFFLPAEKLQEATERDGLPYAAYVKRGLLTLSGDNFVDYHDCFNWFRMLIEQYKIYPLQVGYDRYTAQYLVQDMKQYGFHMDDVFQGFNLTPVIREVEGLLKDGTINIGDNDLLKVHLLNTALKVESDSGRCKIVKMSAADHIDGCAALLDGMTVRQKWYAEIGGQLKNAG
ncbi:MAG: terminase TerL endonuclease subunit [Gemmiger sp.]|uniref:terminase large subunit n=1 Tax=Gemmiger sp. TaxID=2049027 RepID=UPI002A912BC2|nr:terminase TerL endonuclease subunit [Gemmiger sp.]MDY5202864.1 terminase TerL endonuclease subunit [Gemmiger sp.]